MKNYVLTKASQLTFSCLLIIIGALGSTALIGQNRFQKTYSPLTSNARGYCVQQTADDGYIVAGRSDNNSSFNRDATLIKTNASGVIQWTFDYSWLFAGICEARYVIEVDDFPQDGTPDGYAFVGWVWNSDQTGLTDKDVIVAKVDLNGNLLWQTQIGDRDDPFDEQAFCIRQDPNIGDYVLVGSAEILVGGLTPESRVLIAKVDQFSGGIMWDHAYGVHWSTYDGNETQAYSMDLWDWNRDGTDDGWVVAGWVTNNPFLSSLSGEDIYLLGIDWNGNSLGQYRIGVSSGDANSYTGEYGLSVIQKSDGQVVVAGEYIPSINDADPGIYPTIVSVPSNFHQFAFPNWMLHYTGSHVNSAAAYCVKEHSNGLVLASGGTVGLMYQINSDPTPNIGSTVMINTTLGGGVNWAWNYQSMPSSGNTGNGHSVRPTRDGGYVMTGVDNSFGPNMAAHLVKTDAVGISGCHEELLDIDAVSLDPYMLSHGSQLSIILHNINSTVFDDENIAEYVHCVSPKRIPFNEPSTGERSGTSLSSYPNPIQAGQDLAFQLDLNSDVDATIVVSDMMGKTIHNALLEHSAGIVDFYLPTHNWPAGTYTLRIEAGEEVYRDKIVVLE